MSTDKALEDLLLRVKRLEQATFRKNPKRPESIERHGFKGATGGLRLLASKGFFDRKRNFGEIKEALANQGYHYSKQAVQTPLNTLSRAGGLLVGFKEGGKKVYAKRK